jgi:hypothetical protein
MLSPERKKERKKERGKQGEETSSKPVHPVECPVTSQDVDHQWGMR